MGSIQRPPCCSRRPETCSQVRAQTPTQDSPQNAIEKDVSPEANTEPLSLVLVAKFVPLASADMLKLREGFNRVRCSGRDECVGHRKHILSLPSVRALSATMVQIRLLILNKCMVIGKNCD